MKFSKEKKSNDDYFANTNSYNYKDFDISPFMNSIIEDLDIQEINTDFLPELNHTINKITGGKATSNQIKQLLNSLLLITCDQAKKLSNSMEMNENVQYESFPYRPPKHGPPCINIIIANPSNTLFYPSNYTNYQPITQPMTQTPYLINPYYQYPQINQYQLPTIYGQNINQNDNPQKSKSKNHKKKEEGKTKEHKKQKKGKKDKKKAKKKDNIQKFEYKIGNDFNGIIKYLTDKTHGNISQNGTIEVTSDSILPGYPPSNLLDTKSSNQYQSNGFSYAWICFDFKNMKVQLSNYTIKSCEWSRNIGHIRSWVIEVSDDNNTWKIIDTHKDCQDLNGPNQIKTYNVEKYNFQRYIRFRHTDECWDSGTYGFNAIEFYGNLKTNG